MNLIINFHSLSIMSAGISIPSHDILELRNARHIPLMLPVILGHTLAHTQIEYLQRNAEGPSEQIGTPTWSV